MKDTMYPRILLKSKTRFRYSMNPNIALLETRDFMIAKPYLEGNEFPEKINEIVLLYPITKWDSAVQHMFVSKLMFFCLVLGCVRDFECLFDA